MSDQFTCSPEFGVQIIAKGAYEDAPYGNGDIYTVEVTTLRLNPVALNEWQSANAYGSSDSFETDAEWRLHDDEKRAQQEAFNQKIVCLLSLNEKVSKATITQAQAEVFAVVQIWKVTGTEPSGKKYLEMRHYDSGTATAELHGEKPKHVAPKGYDCYIEEIGEGLDYDSLEEWAEQLAITPNEAATLVQELADGKRADITPYI